MNKKMTPEDKLMKAIYGKPIKEMSNEEKNYWLNQFPEKEFTEFVNNDNGRSAREIAAHFYELGRKVGYQEFYKNIMTEAKNSGLI